jgi:hypothetical protein
VSGSAHAHALRAELARISLASPACLSYQGRVLLSLLTAGAVLAPEGWVEDPKLATTFSPDPTAVETRAFHPPDDLDALYVVSRGTGAAPDLLESITVQAQAAGATVVTRTHRVDHGRSIDELVLALPGELRTHMRVVGGMAGAAPELLIGTCRGRRAALATCEVRLAALDLPPVPDVDLSGLRHVLYAIGAAVLGLALGALALLRARRNRDLRRSPPLVDSELVTISGVVQPLGAPLEAPLSGRRCVAHRSRARVFATDASSQLVAEPCEHEVAPFVIETRHGPVRIDARELHLELAPSSLVDTSTSHQRTFRTRHTIDRDVRAYFDEIVIAPGAKVTMRGMVSIEHDPQDASERGYREGAATRTRLVATASQPLTVLRVWQ